MILAWSRTLLKINFRMYLQIFLVIKIRSSGCDSHLRIHVIRVHVNENTIYARKYFCTLQNFHRMILHRTSSFCSSYLIRPEMIVSRHRSVSAASSMWPKCKTALPCSTTLRSFTTTTGKLWSGLKTRRLSTGWCSRHVLQVQVYM